MEMTRLDRGPWARFRRDRRAMACLLILSLELLAVFLLPPMLGLAPNVSDLEAGFWAPPSAEHPLGTDDVGRDLLARLLSGGQVSLLIGLSSAAISVAVGVPLGLLAGYRRGAWEFWIMRLADIFQTFPSIVLVLCLVTLTGASVLNLVLVLGLLGWTGIARLVYGNTLAVRDREYVVAARALGARTGTILRRNVLPNVISPVWCSISGFRYPGAPGLLGQYDPVWQQPDGIDRPALGMAAAGTLYYFNSAVSGGDRRWAEGCPGSPILCRKSCAVTLKLYVQLRPV